MPVAPRTVHRTRTKKAKQPPFLRRTLVFLLRRWMNSLRKIHLKPGGAVRRRRGFGLNAVIQKSLLELELSADRAIIKELMPFALGTADGAP